MKILLTDEPVGAEEALRIGLVNEVVPHAQLMERAERIGHRVQLALFGDAVFDPPLSRD